MYKTLGSDRPTSLGVDSFSGTQDPCLQEVDLARTIWVLKDGYVWIETGGGCPFKNSMPHSELKYSFYLAE